MKLLFVCNNMHIGGVQKALLNLLRQISDKYDITLMLFHPAGELMGRLPENVKVITGNSFTGILGMSQGEAKEKGFFTFAHRSIWAMLTKLFGIGFSFSVLTRMQKLPEEYDAAISYMQNSAFKMFYGGCNEFVVNSVKAKKKITFVHCDFKNYFGNNEYNRGYYSRFDSIACVSESCRAVFDDVCPQCAEKTVTVLNCHDFEAIDTESREYEAKYTDGVTNIFTAARISEEKGILRMLPIFERLKKEGKRFVWRVAGSGPLMDEALAQREKRGLDDCVEFLGMLDNPYPYFMKSDLLLVPSYNEAAPMVYGEAEYFGLPVLTTDTTSAVELIERRGAGVVCANSDEALEDALFAAIDRFSFSKERTPRADVTNKTALEQFDNLI